MSAAVGDLRVSVGQRALGAPALLLDVPVDTQSASEPVAVAALDRREVEDLRELCDRFLAGEQVRL